MEAALVPLGKDPELEIEPARVGGEGDKRAVLEASPIRALLDVEDPAIFASVLAMVRLFMDEARDEGYADELAVAVQKGSAGLQAVVLEDGNVGDMLPLLDVLDAVAIELQQSHMIFFRQVPELAIVIRFRDHFMVAIRVGEGEKIIMRLHCPVSMRLRCRELVGERAHLPALALGDPADLWRGELLVARGEEVYGARRWLFLLDLLWPVLAAVRDDDPAVEEIVLTKLHA